MPRPAWGMAWVAVWQASRNIADWELSHTLLSWLTSSLWGTSCVRHWDEIERRAWHRTGVCQSHSAMGTFALWASGPETSVHPYASPHLFSRVFCKIPCQVKNSAKQLWSLCMHIHMYTSTCVLYIFAYTYEITNQLMFNCLMMQYSVSMESKTLPIYMHLIY